MLDEAARAHNESCWWIKALGLSGPGESDCGVCSGGVNLANGTLVTAYEFYEHTIRFSQNLNKHGN